MPDAVAGPKAASKSSKHLGNLFIEFFVSRCQVECQQAEREKHNQDIEQPVAPVGDYDYSPLYQGLYRHCTD